MTPGEFLTALKAMVNRSVGLILTIEELYERLPMSLRVVMEFAPDELGGRAAGYRETVAGPIEDFTPVLASLQAAVEARGRLLPEGALDDVGAMQVEEPGPPPDALTDWVIGYRGWNLTSEGGLTPISWGEHSNPWRGNAEVEAVCATTPPRANHNGPEDTVPGDTCDCGLYAWFDIDQVGGHIQGAVRARGDMQIHPTGFRAQYMQPIAFKQPTHPSLTLPKLGLPVFDTMQELADFASGYGSPVPMSLRHEPLDPYSPQVPRDAQFHMKGGHRSMLVVRGAKS